MLYYPGFHPNVTWLRSVLLFTDEVKRIVPTDYPTDDPVPLKSMRDSIDGCLVNLPPAAVDVSPNPDELYRLDRAFRLLQESPTPALEKREKFQVLITKEGNFSFPGFDLMADDKIADEVRQLIKKYRLEGTSQTKLTKALSSRAGTIVATNASHLILSLVADRMARRYGLNTLTDKSREYAFTALNGLDIPFLPPSNSAEGLLTAAFASVLIPEDIGRLQVDDYRILRDTYSELRAAVRNFVVESNAYCGLDKIHDLAVLQQRVVEAASNVQKEYEAFRKSRFARRIGKWTPFVIGGLLPLLGQFDLIPRDLTWILTPGGFAFKILEKVQLKSVTVRDRVFSLCTSLDYNVKALLPDGTLTRV